MVDVEERVYRLEVVLEEFIKNVEIAQMRTEAEIRVLKEEMRVFKDEMRNFKDEMKDFKDEMKNFKDEMRDFKDEMRAFKEESRRERAEMNKKWGEITNKLGTFAEDMVAPNIKGIAKKYFGCEDLDFFGVRIKKRHSTDKSKRREFDCIAVCEDIVILNETKATPRIEYINDFVNVLKEFYDYFPEYRDKKLIPIFASMYLGGDMVNYLTKNGIYAMAIKEDTMDLLNYDDIIR